MLFCPIDNRIIDNDELIVCLEKTHSYKDYFVAIEPVSLLDLLHQKNNRQIFFKFSSFLVEINDVNVIYTGLSHFIKELNDYIDDETLLKNITTKKRNQIRKGLKASFIVRESLLSENNIDWVYNLYISNMNRHGTKPKSKIFFEKLINYNSSIINILSPNKALVATNVLVEAFPYCKVQFSLSDPSFWSYNVNDRLYFETIKAISKRGFKFLDFGPSLSTDLSHINFKLQFGAKQYQIFVVENLYITSKIKRKMQEYLWRIKSKAYRVFLKKIKRY